MPKNSSLFIQQTLRSLRFLPGSPARARLFDAVPEDTRAILEGSVVATAWYDERHTVELCHAIVKVLGLTGQRAIIQYFREQQILAYSRIYKTILPFVKPETIAVRGSSFWRRQHDTGELEVLEVGPEGCLIRFTGNPNVCDPIYSLAVTGGVEAGFALTRAQCVRGEPKVVSPTTMVLRVSWQS